MNPDPGLYSSIEIIIIVVSLLLTSLTVASQKCISEVNRNSIRELAEEGNRKAIRVEKLLDSSYKMISSMMIVISFFGFIIGALVTLNHIEYIIMFAVKCSLPYAGAIAVFLLALISTVVFCVIGIFLPRQLARQHADGMAMALSGYATFVVIVLKPVSMLLTGITNIILKILRQDTSTFDEKFSEEDVISMLEKGQESGALKEEGKKMINSIFAFDDKLAYEIMTPRTDVFSIDINDQTDVFLDELMEMRYSRIPVYDDDSDNIIGILNIKDFLIKARKDGFDNVKIEEILREPFFVPETKNIDSLFFELQKTKQHIAILIDEYGGFSGIVTMEDIIEEVMGDIDDEFDEEEIEIQDLGNGKYLIDGYTNIDDVNEETHASLESETSETIGGFIIDILGEIPSDDPDEIIKVEYENYMFEVLNVKDRRIEKVIMTVLSKFKDNEDIKERKNDIENTETGD